MIEKWLVIGTDARLKIVAKKLSDETRTIFYKSTESWDNELNEAVAAFQPTHIILPIQPLQITAPVHITVKPKWFVGKLNSEWEKVLESAHVSNYLQYEPFIWKNAELTALGLLTYFLNEQVILKNKKIIVTGFGRVAKMIAKLFALHGATVIITARSEVQLAEAAAYGYDTLLLNPNNEREADYLVNTIPYQWLNEAYAIYQRLKILDVASKPGCIGGELENLNYEFLHALPSKYFPAEAAILLYEAVNELNKGGESC